MKWNIFERLSKLESELTELRKITKQQEENIVYLLNQKTEEPKQVAAKVNEKTPKTQATKLRINAYGMQKTKKKFLRSVKHDWQQKKAIAKKLITGKIKSGCKNTAVSTI